MNSIRDARCPRLDHLATAIDRFDLRKEDFLAVIDGMEMDASADIRAPSFQQLDLYCDRVAGAVGRLSVRVFGMHESEGQLLAHHLGRALQLTNILRDLDEDAAIGRLYLPLEALLLAKIGSTDPQTVVSNPHIGQVCAVVAERAREHFAQADEIMSASPTAHCPRAEDHGGSLSADAGGHGSARLVASASSHSLQQIASAMDCVTVCVRLMPARSTSSGRGSLALRRPCV